MSGEQLASAISMRLVPILAAIVTFALTGTAQSFPESVDVVQRIDQLYPWLNIAAFDADAQGNVYLAGSSIGTIPDAVNIRVGPLGGADIVVIKFDPIAQRMLYGVAIGGSADDSVRQIKVDARGNVYLIGITQSADFPFLFTQGPRSESVILKLGSTGTLMFSTNLGWAGATAFDVDAAGAVYLGGNTLRGELPTSPESYLPEPVPASAAQSFIAKLDDLGRPVAATYVVPNVSHLLLRRDGTVLFSAVDTVEALDNSLSRNLFSVSTDIERYTTADEAGTIDFGLDDLGSIYIFGPNALRKYTPDGQTLLFSRDFSGENFLPVAVTRSGLVYLFGIVSSNVPPHNATQPCAADLPASISGVSEGGGFLLVIGPAGETRYATYISETIDGFSPRSFSSGSDLLYALADATLVQEGTHWKGIVRLNPDEIPGDHISAACLSQAGTTGITRITPGTIMILIGSGLGPQDGASYVLQDGRVPFTLAGTSVTVDGKPVPILYTQDGQVEFVTPFSLRTDGAIVPVCATFGGDTSCLNALTFSVDPGFYFTTKNVIAAINSDGTINSQDHPAKGGTYVSVYFTGGGTLEGTVVDGGIAGLELHPLTAAASATITFCSLTQGCGSSAPTDAPVLFVGAVPTLVYGANVAVVQIPPAPANTLYAQFTLHLLALSPAVDQTASSFFFVTP